MYAGLFFCPKHFTKKPVITVYRENRACYGSIIQFVIVSYWINIITHPAVSNDKYNNFNSEPKSRNNRCCFNLWRNHNNNCRYELLFKKTDRYFSQQKPVMFFIDSSLKPFIKPYCRLSIVRFKRAVAKIF